jgi:predicted nucleic acid-binding Zn ribbon protein
MIPNCVCSIPAISQSENRNVHSERCIEILPIHQKTNPFSLQMYRVGAILLSTVLFIAFVPGVLVKLPPKAGVWTTLLVHGLLFSVILHFAMKWYHRNVVFREGMGNYGPTCPNGYVMQADESCVPSGKQTELVNTGFRPSLP